MTSFYKGSSIIQPFQDGLIIGSASAIVMTINFFVMMGLLGYYSLVHFNLTIANNYSWENGVVMVGLISLLIMIGYLVKLSTTWMTKVIVGGGLGVTEYRYNILFFVHHLGIVLLPIVLALVFVDQNYKEAVPYFAYGVVCLLYFYRIIKSAIVGVRASVPPLYLFVYLCTLEFLPLVVIIKLLIGQNLGLD